MEGISLTDKLERVRQRYDKVKILPMPESVTSFVMFLGWARSGHSFIGQALHAHPNALIGNEGMLYDYFDHYPNRDAVYSYVRDLAVRFGRRGYQKTPKFGNPQNLKIEGGHQDEIDSPIVIGNSKASKTSILAGEHPDSMDKFMETLALPAKVVMVQRHPLDMIASNMKRKNEPDPTKLWPDLEAVMLEPQRAVDYFDSRGVHVHSIIYEDFLDDVAGSMENLFEFVGLPPAPDVAQAVEKSAYRKPERPSENYPKMSLVAPTVERLIEESPLFEAYRSDRFS